MAYDRFDDRRTYRSPRGRRPYGYDREDRGFFDRAADEVASWFGDERAERRRDLDERFDDRDDWIDFDGYRERRPSAFYGHRDQGRFERNRSLRDEESHRPYTGRFSSRSQPQDQYDYDRGYTQNRWGRAQTQDEFTGTATGLYDRDYSNWRRQQIDQLDRDYDEFRRENSSRFEKEFSQWRDKREEKRGLLKQIDEHMDVVGQDGNTVGKVDKIRGDRVVLTKNDSPDGRHHSLGCTMIDKVDDGKVWLDCDAEEALDKLLNENRNRALFEDDQNRQDGPHMLDRSFSGTY